MTVYGFMFYVHGKWIPMELIAGVGRQIKIMTERKKQFRLLVCICFIFCFVLLTLEAFFGALHAWPCHVTH